MIQAHSLFESFFCVSLKLLDRRFLFSMFFSLLSFWAFVGPSLFVPYGIQANLLSVGKKPGVKGDVLRKQT